MEANAYITGALTVAAFGYCLWMFLLLGITVSTGIERRGTEAQWSIYTWIIHLLAVILWPANKPITWLGVQLHRPVIWWKLFQSWRVMRRLERNPPTFITFIKQGNNDSTTSNRPGKPAGKSGRSGRLVEPDRPRRRRQGKRT